MTGCRTLMTGNEAIGEGAIRASCDCYFGYPITPQNELIEFMATRMPQQNRVFLQAESELAAINMVFGAAAAGKRAMTSSSSPGISLKQEGISLLAGAELPAVIVNVQRGGPGLGNIAPAQSDYFQAVKGGGHGDYHSIVLAPCSVQEMYDHTILAFDLGDRYRTPVIVLADGRLGQMMEPLLLGESSVCGLSAKPWAVNGCAGRKPNRIRSLYLVDGELEALNVRLQAKYEQIRGCEVRFESIQADDCEYLVVAYGTCARVASAALSRARASGIKIGLIRPITVWPFPYGALGRLAGQVRGVLVVEMSAGQMVEDVALAMSGRTPIYFEGRQGGGIPTESAVLRRMEEMVLAAGNKREWHPS